MTLEATMNVAPELTIRVATSLDADDIWPIIEAVIRGGDVYTLPADMSRDDALSYWFAPAHRVYVALDDDRIVGSYYLRANQMGGGSHVANCGYATLLEARGRGVAGAMCLHSLERARELGFRAMQFNFVVSTNGVAVRLWTKLGFSTVGVLPKAFAHPVHGDVDAFVMFRSLTE